MSIELKLLLYSIVVLIVLLVMQTVAGMIQNGLGYTLSPRDEGSDGHGYGARLERAFYNMLETFPIFATLVIMVELTEGWTSLTALGAQLYFWGRVFYVPAYVSGIPFARTIIWLVATAGMCLIGWELIALVNGRA